MANFKHAKDDRRHVSAPGEMPAARAPVEPDKASAARDGAAGGVPCVIPSFAAASQLLSAPYSCLVLNPHRRHVALAPQYLNKKRTGIQEELDGELLKFSQSVNGVPLAYDNIRLLGQRGHIYDDSGYIHMDIEANFIVFQPKKGQTLLGKVNKLAMSHVGCLVHGCFNASIPKPNRVSMETWRDNGPKIGTELEFKVMALDADAAGVLLIRGQLDRTRVQELLAMSENSESGVPIEQLEPQEAEPAAEPTLQSPDDTPKKKKKKKKEIKEEETEGEIPVPSIPANQLNGTTDETNGKKKKKKKKDKHLKEEQEEVEISREDDGSNSSVSEKPRKKRKRESVTDPTSSTSEDNALTKPMKKRRGEADRFV
ncbi:DNA-directed RNA polymerase I subunit RPA43 [Nematolebias whitei]|uniref:DNA-directed RNA polymerase I subunit RPA43 n=1 Tax=Nematolebias whitei TaxID=451745 RepID=UPI00189ACA68|nr:DNA-directed RNA polymerase I subunit RPA43 [Nematolebias whitei]